jgi:hypothetical protein
MITKIILNEKRHISIINEHINYNRKLQVILLCKLINV